MGGLLVENLNYSLKWPRKTHHKGGGFHVSKFPLLFSCLPFSGLVFLLSPCFVISLKL